LADALTIKEMDYFVRCNTDWLASPDERLGWVVRINPVSNRLPKLVKLYPAIDPVILFPV
jgi:hypothetical protein